MEAWSRAVLEWVNCLGILDRNVNDLQELRDRKFYAKLIKILSRKEFEEDIGDNDLVHKFVQDTFPEFVVGGEGDNGLCEQIYLASLLLLQSSQEPKLHKPMCIKLSNETQLKIKAFLEKVLGYGCSVTRENVETIIMETVECVIRTPPATPKMRPLKDFFNSPVTTVRKNFSRLMDERTREVRRLKAELETERFEKADLQEDLEIQREKINSLQKKLQEKIVDLKKIREESTRLQTPQSSRKAKDVKTPRNLMSTKVQTLAEEIDVLKSKIIDLEDEKKLLARKLASSERNCVIIKERSDMNERNLETLLIEADMKNKEIEELKIHNDQLRGHMQEMRRQTIEDQSFEMEVATMSDSMRSWNGSEVLSSVIDIQLQEAKEESKVYKSQLEDLKRRLKSVQGEYQVIKHSNETLMVELSSLQSVKQELSKVQRELDEYVKKSIALDAEKSRFEEQANKFQSLFLSEEQLLQQSRQENKKLEISLHELEDSLNKTNSLFNVESSKVKQLQEVVLQKDLERDEITQKYINLEQDKMELLVKTTDLRNLVALKEDSLMKIGKQKQVLEFDLRNLEAELISVKNSLSEKKIRVQDLEVTLMQTKLEHERTAQAELLRFEDLQTKHVNLTQEKVHLWQEADNLKKRISSNEDSLKQCQLENQRLESELCDRINKLQTLEDVLAEERARVKLLESTVLQIETERDKSIESQTIKYVTLEEKYIDLEQTKLSLIKDHKDFEREVAAKIEFLEQACQKANEKVQTIQDLLDKGRSRIENLESTVNRLEYESEETRKSQLMQYQALEEKNTKLNKDNLRLLTEIENLNSLVSSKDEVLLQVHQQNEKFKLDIHNLNENVQAVQNLLTAERTRCKDLEATLHETNLKHEITLEKQLSEYQNLEQRCMTLKQESVSLSQEIENLNLKITLKEDALLQSQHKIQKSELELQDLNNKYQILHNSLSEAHTITQDLESTIIGLKQNHEDDLVVQGTKYQDLEDKFESLEQEKLRLLQNIDDLNHKIVKSGDLQNMSEQQIETLKSELEGMHEKLRTLENSLIIERTKVKNLESTLALVKQEHERALGTQVRACQDLEKKSASLEQEKARLLQDTEDLNLEIVSAKALLQQSEQQNQTLESELRNMRANLRNVEDLLGAEKTKVENLESTLALVKQEHEKVLGTQVRACQDLEQKSESLEQEKVRLLQNTEDLNLEIVSGKDLLKQSEQQNQTLESELRDMRANLQNVEDLLATEKTKVQNLERALACLKHEKEEEFALQVEKYQDLEQKLTDLKQEKFRLLQDTEELNLEIRSSKELLNQSEHKNQTLILEVQDMQGKLQSAEATLTLERTQIADLKSTLISLKEESADALRIQLSRYQDLEEKSANVNQENLRLLQETENLNHSIAFNENLLKQYQKTNENLKSNLRDLNDKLQTVENSLTEERRRIVDLQATVTQTKSEQAESFQSQSLKYQELKEECLVLEQEKLCILQKTEDLEHKITLNENLLAEFQKKNGNLESDVRDLNNKLEFCENSLSEERTKVKDLESTVKLVKQEMEESIERHSQSYQALEQKLTALQQDKLNLVEDNAKLKNLLLSKEELLHQLQECNAKLEANLCELTDKLKNVQTEFDTAVIKVNTLECASAQTKLEMDKIIESHLSSNHALQHSNQILQAEIELLKSARQDFLEAQEQLQKQSSENRDEKSKLLEQIMELKLNVSLKEELLKQSVEQKEKVQAKLDDLGEEIQSVRDLLSTTNTKVQELESTVGKAESERKEGICIIEKLKSENMEHKNLIESCGLILAELIEHSARLTGENITALDNFAILDLSNQLRALIKSLEAIYNSKVSDLKNFETAVSTLNSTVLKLKADVSNFEEIKVKDDQALAEYLKEIIDLRVIAKDKESLSEDVAKLNKQLNVETTKIKSLTKEKTLIGQSLYDVKNSLNVLRNEKLILVQHVENQNRELRTEIASMCDIIKRLQNQIELDNNTLLSLKEEKNSLASEYDKVRKLSIDLETKCETLENENRLQTTEKKDLKDKLNVIRVRNAKLEKNLDELRKENKRLEAEKTSTDDKAKVEELSTCVSKLQLENQELQSEKIELSKRPTQQDFETRLKEVHIEYDQKLEKLKQKMKGAYNEQIAKISQDQERLMQEKLNAQRVKIEEQCCKHAEEITKYKDHVTKLSSQFWDIGEKLLVEKQHKEQLEQQLQDLSKRLHHERSTAASNTASQYIPTSRNKTSSLDRREFAINSRVDATARTVDTIKEEHSTSARRESLQSVQTMQGMGNAFEIEDEEGEVFNTNYLADMKAGRCTVAPDMERLSVLQMRNAQCKPHLKSSYPAETQFQPGPLTEEEIKSGSALEDIFNDSLSQSLLPGEKTKKRDRTQTLYKRPGPPTPSKHGSRLSLQGNELKSPNSRVLRERNVERRSTATPRRLKDLFGGSSRRQDENVSGTPKGRRLSSIFRKPK